MRKVYLGIASKSSNGDLIKITNYLKSRNIEYVTYDGGEYDNRILDSCDEMIFITESNKTIIGKGLYTEITQTLDKNKPVYHFVKGMLKKVESITRLKDDKVDWFRFGIISYETENNKKWYSSDEEIYDEEIKDASEDILTHNNDDKDNGDDFSLQPIYIV